MKAGGECGPRGCPSVLPSLGSARVPLRGLCGRPGTRGGRLRGRGGAGSSDGMAAGRGGRSGAGRRGAARGGGWPRAAAGGDAAVPAPEGCREEERDGAVLAACERCDPSLSAPLSLWERRLSAASRPGASRPAEAVRFVPASSPGLDSCCSLADLQRALGLPSAGRARLLAAAVALCRPSGWTAGRPACRREGLRAPFLSSAGVTRVFFLASPHLLGRLPLLAAVLRVSSPAGKEGWCRQRPGL